MSLNLAGCWLEDAGIRLLLQMLLLATPSWKFWVSDITASSPVGLADITRLLESTHIKHINFGFNSGLFNDADANKSHSTLSQRYNTKSQVCKNLYGLNNTNSLEDTTSKAPHSLASAFV
jgi:hypothetical protein